MLDDFRPLHIESKDQPYTIAKIVDEAMDQARESSIYENIKAIFSAVGTGVLINTRNFRMKIEDNHLQGRGPTLVFRDEEFPVVKIEREDTDYGTVLAVTIDGKPVNAREHGNNDEHFVCVSRPATKREISNLIGFVSQQFAPRCGV
jgi:hypothetical protein